MSCFLRCKKFWNKVASTADYTGWAQAVWSFWIDPPPLTLSGYEKIMSCWKNLLYTVENQAETMLRGPAASL